MASPLRERAELQPAIDELRALRLENDLAEPLVADGLFGPLVDLYRGLGSAGDHLRLPVAANYDAPTLSAAVGRILRAPAGDTALASPLELSREEGMRRVLRALDTTVREIRQRAAAAAKE